MNQEFTQISDHFDIIKRRIIPFASAFLAVFLAAVLLAFWLPATYESEGMILIEGQEIPEEFVQSTITTFADEQIQVIGQRVMTQQNLEKIINQYDLYDASESQSNMADAISELRDSVNVEPVRASVTDERSQRTGYVTIAFTVAFTHGDPGIAMNVATQLIQLFLEANAAERAAITSGTTQFLESEAKKLSEEIAKIENRMAGFKEKYSNSLPELSDLNFKQLDRAEQDLDQTERDIRTNQERRTLFHMELASIPPYASVYGDGGELVSTEDRLAALQRELLTKSSIYSEDHPDIIRLRREITLLSGEVGSPADIRVLTGSLEAKRLELDEALRRYSSDHPDVVRLKSNIDNLKAQISQARDNSQPTLTRRPPDNPRYLQIQAQLNFANQEASALNSQRDELRQDLKTYQDRLTKTPQTERQWLTLTRDYDLSVTKYREVSAQIDEAYRAETLESAQKGERFTLLEPPRLPIDPISPNRPFIFFCGLILAIGLSVGVAIALETIDTTVRGGKDVISILGAPPLATIPILKNSSDIAMSIRHKFLITAGFAGAIALLITILL